MSENHKKQLAISFFSNINVKKTFTIAIISGEFVVLKYGRRTRSKKPQDTLPGQGNEGTLDVDANAGTGISTTTPEENIF